MSDPAAAIVRVRVLLFAGLADAAGSRCVDLELPATPRPTAGTALEQLATAHPAIAAQRDGLALAIGDRYVAADAALSDGDDLALIPPVSGG